MISDLTIGNLTIDCNDAERLRDFYAGLMGCEKTIVFGCTALRTDNSLTILFAKTGILHVPPVWPEEPGKQQKQMHLDFTVNDISVSVDKAIQLGAMKAATQYGGKGCVTMLDPEGHPFCICNRVKSTSEFAMYFEEKGYGEIPDISINIDCKNSEILRGFYARLTDWDQGFHPTALIPENRMVIHFMAWAGDFDYVPPVWPEAPGTQQKQMHFNFQVNDLRFAVNEAIRIGATKAAEQYDDGHFVAMLDTEGHPFCLSSRE